MGALVRQVLGHDPRLENVTARQRECLNLVYDGMSSKEIALQLGLGPGTVDNHIKAAMRTLGTTSRFEAAKAINQSLSTDYPRLDSQPPHLPEPAVEAHSETVSQPEEQRDGPPPSLVMNDQALPIEPLDWVDEPLRPHLPIGESRHHDLSLASKVGLSIALAALVVILLLGVGALMKDLGPAVADIRCFFKPTTCQAGGRSPPP